MMATLQVHKIKQRRNGQRLAYLLGLSARSLSTWISYCVMWLELG
jgi:hypothetical protein